MGDVTIDKYSHYFKISGHGAEALTTLNAFCTHLTHYSSKKNPEGRYERVQGKVFASRSFDKQEYRLPITVLPHFTAFLEGRGFYKSHSVKVVEHTPYTPAFADIDINPEIEPRDYQVPILDFTTRRDQQVTTLVPKYRRVVPIQMGKGKDQPLDALIKVPGGWKSMGEMKVGTKVSAPDGTTTVVTGVFPQGKKEVYKVTFADGRSTECGINHLWKVFYINTTPHKRWRVVDTKELIRLLGMHEPRVYVQLIEPDEGKEFALPIAPYSLGVILGDGSISTNTFTISKLDKEVFDNVEAEFPSGLKFVDVDHVTKRIVSGGKRNVYLETLREYGLFGTRSHEKFIPHEYLHASRGQRLALLQGLLDTDGTVQKSGSVSFSSASKKLAEGVQYLVRSLGGIAAIRPRQTYFTYKDEHKAGKTCYDVDIRHPKPSSLFRLTRKKERTNDENQYANGLKLRVEKVELVGEKETQCISVEHPDHLYITDDFIVTHNTLISLMTIAQLKVRTAIVLLPRFIQQWVEAIEDDENGAFNFKGSNWKKGDLLVIKGGRDLSRLIALAQAGELEAKIIIFSNRTLSIYIDEYEKNLIPEFYGCTPDKLWQTLGVGLRLTDEVHMDFHANFKLDLYTHVPGSIELSATLNPSDDFLKKMYKVMLPFECRYTGLAYDQYIAVTAIFYSFENPKNIKFKRAGMYSHTLFEDSIKKYAKVTKNYYSFIGRLLDSIYVREWKPLQKCLVFCGKIETCESVGAFLRQLYPQFKIGVFVGGSDETILKDSDIIVSTLQSCGTAKDIPNLVSVLTTVASDTNQGNEQALGRLRPIKAYPDMVPRYYYLVCSDIQKHVQYHRTKLKTFHGKAKSHSSVNSGIRI